MHEAGPSDEQLGAALRKWTGTSPALHPVGELLDRHWTAAFAYARLCTDGPRAAGMLTTAAFTRLFGASLRQAGPTAAWRPHVLVAVRRIAAEWDTDERRELLHPALRSDDGTGERVAARLLPPPGRRLLSRAFQRVPETSRAVLWHTEVEAEPLSVPAALLGLDEDGAGVELRRARERLRDECLQAHRELAPEDECRRYLRMLDVTFRRGGTDIDPDLGQHLARCPHCTRTADQLDRFNAGLGTALAEAVLGWGAHGYLESRTTRAAVPPPAAAVTPADEAALPHGGSAVTPPAGESFTGAEPPGATGPAGSAAPTGPAAPAGSADPATSGTAAGRGGAAGRRIPGALRRAAGSRASTAPSGTTDPGGPAAPSGRRAPGAPGRAAGFRASSAPPGTADTGGTGDSADLAGPPARRAPGARRRGVGSRSSSAPPGSADTGGRGGTGRPGGSADPAGSAVPATPARPTGPPGHAAVAGATGRTSPAAPGSPRSLHRAVRRARRRQLAVAVLAVGGLVALPLVLWAVHGSGDAPGTGAAATPSRTPGRNVPSPGASWVGGSGAGQGALHGRLHNLTSGLCVGVVGKKAVRGAETELTGCSAAPAQQWTYETDGLLRNAAAPDLCLDSRLGYSVRLAPCAATGRAARTIRYDFTLQGALVPRSDQELALTPAATDGSGALVLKTRAAAGAGQRWTVDTAKPDLRMENVNWDGDTVPVPVAPPAVPATTPGPTP
ncbi:ricin-type beta-trefoil lectin domain protein [Streptomyces sp. NPDC014991]|uniref:RICIN domain-containing protein n=1 Tax=Streptomyces sp. NPDC014991 TaxID=3364935 RepID=UPI0036FEEC58